MYTIKCCANRNCQGIALLTSIKVGIALVGGQGGSGIVLTKTKDNKWSAPLAVGFGGASFGFVFFFSFCNTHTTDFMF